MKRTFIKWILQFFRIKFVVNKVSPRPSMTVDSEAINMIDSFTQQQQSSQTSSSQSNQSTNINNNQQKPEPGKAPSRAGACRVCLKSFKPDDFSKICAECQQKVCEDCASYSKLDESEDAVNKIQYFFVSVKLKNDNFSNSNS